MKFKDKKIYIYIDANLEKGSGLLKDKSVIGLKGFL